MIYDVRGFDSLAPSYISQDMTKVLSTASNTKLVKYESHGRAAYPNMEVKAFIFDTLSGPSASAISLIKSIANKGHISSKNPEKFVRDAIAAISAAIQVDNYAIVMKSFESVRP